MAVCWFLPWGDEHRQHEHLGPDSRYLLLIDALTSHRTSCHSLDCSILLHSAVRSTMELISIAFLKSPSTLTIIYPEPATTRKLQIMAHMRSWTDMTRRMWATHQMIAAGMRLESSPRSHCGTSRCSLKSSVFAWGSRSSCLRRCGVKGTGLGILLSMRCYSWMLKN